MRVAHLPIDLGFRDQCGNGVDDNHIDRTASDEGLRDLERLLPRIGL